MKLSVTAHHNEYLPAGESTLDVIVTVRADDRPGAAADPGAAAEVILLDCSGSMGAPQAKMRAAQRAAVAAVDALPDGVAFALVGGSQTAEMIYPADPVPAVADESTRAEARRAVGRVVPHGGTAIGAWLRLARTLLTQRPDAIKHAVLLTDGRNETETAEQLRTELAACAGLFTVDCRGIGSVDGVHDWDGAELLGIAEALGANPVVGVEDLGTLPAEVTRVLDRTLAAAAGDVRLWVRRSELAKVRFVKQVYPVIADLTGRGGEDEIPIGAWSPGDRRDYHVSLDVEAMPAGTRRRIAWFAASAGPGPDQDGEAGVTVEWTDDYPLFSSVHPTVAHYTRQQDLAEAIRLGSAALAAGDPAESLRQFGQAVAAAEDTADTAKLDLLGRVVVADGPEAGGVRFRGDADPRRLPPLTAGGPLTSSWMPAPAAPPPVTAWQHCERVWTERFCGACGIRHDQVA